MRRKIKFNSADLQHIYQRAKDRGVIFYTIEDRLVYYTLAATKARKYNITVIAAALMYTHVHQAIYSRTLSDVQNYLKTLNSSFSRLYNSRYGRKGQLFDEDPGRAGKFSLKDKKSNIIYVYNNHVEKGLCEKAVQERWSFLAYSENTNPFSEEIMKNNISANLRKAKNLVNRRIRKLKALEYCDFDRILPGLTDSEQKNLFDYIIAKYSWIDFKEAARHFNGLDSMIIAIDSSTGSEYDLNEEYTRIKDDVYRRLISFCQKHIDIRDIYTMPSTQKIEFMKFASRNCCPIRNGLQKFFHYSVV